MLSRTYTNILFEKKDNISFTPVNNATKKKKKKRQDHKCPNNREGKFNLLFLEE